MLDFDKVKKDHWKPFVLFFGVFLVLVIGISTGTMQWVLLGFLVSLLFGLVSFGLSLLYCIVFLIFKGLMDYSTSINYGTILPWLKFMDYPTDNSWEHYADRKR